MIKQSQLLQDLNETSTRLFSANMDELTEKQAYKVVCTLLREMLAKKRKDFKEKNAKKEAKQVYYMSMEFLVGTSLRNNLYNLGVENEMRAVLKKVGFDIENLYALDPDAGLGNGGLGRLASCYMDSLSSLGIPATGYSIRYEFGIFKQKIIDGWQMEFPDDWLNLGDVWLSARPDESVTVKFGGRVNEYMNEDGYHAEHLDFVPVVAVPYDMYISGYDSEAVNKLVLWSAKSPKNLDMAAFSRGEYAKALETVAPYSNDFRAYNTYAVALMMNKEFEKAIPYLEKAIAEGEELAEKNLKFINSELEWEKAKNKDRDEYIKRFE